MVSLSFFLVSGLLCRALCGLLQSVRYLLEHLKELVRWLEQTIRQCDKGNLLEAAVWTVMLAIAFLATIAPEQGQCRASFTDTSGNAFGLDISKSL